jgi:fatty acid-binding protein DegV
MSIRIVTASTASIPPETAQALGITIVPLLFSFGAVLGTYTGPATAAVAVVTSLSKVGQS